MVSSVASSRSLDVTKTAISVQTPWTGNAPITAKMGAAKGFSAAVAEHEGGVRNASISGLSTADQIPICYNRRHGDAQRSNNMFGQTIDYYLLKPFAHARNRANEVELNERAAQTTYTLSDAKAHLQKVIHTYFDGKLKVDPSLSYLDIGCGMGRLSIALADAGVRDVVGVDVVPRQIDEAKIVAERLLSDHRPQFYCADVNQWKTDRKFDILFGLGFMEHVNEPDRLLASLPGLMKPGGVALLSFEPFQAPTGDHLNAFFRIPIPWRGLLFSEKALIRLRREYFRPTDPAERLEDIVGGLNKMKYGEWLRYIRQAGLRIDFINVNPQLRRHQPLGLISDVVTKVPIVGRYFSALVYVMLRRIDDRGP